MGYEFETPPAAVDGHGALPGLGIFAVWLWLAFGGTHGTLAGWARRSPFQLDRNPLRLHPSTLGDSPLLALKADF